MRSPSLNSEMPVVADARAGRRALAAGVIVLGVVSLGAGSALLVRPPTVHARLAVSLDAHPTPENVADVVHAASQIAATLAELAQFDTFRDEILASGFGITSDAVGSRPFDPRFPWGRGVSVARIGDTLVLHITARGRTADDARRLAGAVVHLLSLRAATVVGNHVVHVRIDRLPAGAESSGRFFGVSCSTAGVLLLMLGIVIALRAPVAVPRPAPREPGVVSSVLPMPREERKRVTPEEAREWLRNFLETHQQSPQEDGAELPGREVAGTPRTSPDARENV
jgi:hypothetical protein